MIFDVTKLLIQNQYDVHTGWEWKNHQGQKMINKVASTIQVGLRLECTLKCTMSPICDSYNYRPSDKTCQLNTDL